MITAPGKIHIKRYLGGFVPAIAQSIAFGISAEGESENNTELGFEVGRVDISLTSFDFITGRIVFKAELPDEFSGKIYEAALYSVAADSVAGQYDSRLLVSFDSNSESWIDTATGLPGTYETGDLMLGGTSRIGPNSLRQNPAATQSMTHGMNQLAIDLSGYSGNDKFIFAYNVGNVHTTSIRFRFMTDSSNYYDITLGAQTAGYHVEEASKSSAVATGSPNWASITELRVTTTSGAGGTSEVDLDGIRIEDVDTVNPEYVMVAREVIGTPYAKESGQFQAIEFTLDVNIV